MILSTFPQLMQTTPHSCIRTPGMKSSRSRYRELNPFISNKVDQVQIKVNRLYAQCLSPESLSVDAETAIINEFTSLNPDINKVCRLIPRVKNTRLLTSLFIRIPTWSCAMNNSDKAKLISLLLIHADLCESDRNRIFKFKDIMSHMHKGDLVHQYLSLENPVEEPAFIEVVGLTRIHELLLFCMKHELVDSISKLSLRMPDLSFKQFIKTLLSSGAETDMQSVLLIPTECLFVAKEEFLAYFDSLSTIDFQQPTNIKLANLFFGSEKLGDYLLSEGGASKLEDLKSAFSILLRNRNFLDSDLAYYIPLLALKIFPLDSLYVSDLCTQLFLSADVTLSPFLIHLIDYLSIPAMNQLEAKLVNMIKKGGDLERDAKIFIQHAKKKHICIWKLSGSYDRLQNLPLLCKGTQIGKDGIIDFPKATNIINTLNSNAPNPICFDQESLVEELEGGVCSAMSFRALKMFENQPDNLIAPERIKNIGPSILSVQTEYRSIQAAYNTISRIDESHPFTTEFNRAKIEALLKHECPTKRIVSQSQTFNIDHPTAPVMIATCLELLPEGKYIVRSLQPIDSIESDESKSSDDDSVDTSKSKGEHYGHTTLLIKQKNATYYYDPAVGFMEFTDVAQFPMLLAWEHEKWSLPETTLYQISN
jgi:hypothetical protein